MDQFPDEILITIFSFLESKVKVNLSLVCKRFYFLIAESSILMRDVGRNIKIISSLLETPDYQKTVELVSKSFRKYQHLTITNLKNVNAELLIANLNNFAENARIIEINGEISIDRLSKVLSCFDNVEQLYLYNLDISGSGGDIQISKYWPNLKSFKCSRGAIRAFEIIQKCDKLKEFRAEQHRPEDINVPKLEEFLFSQKDLKHLEILNFRQSTLFENCDIEKAEFRLNSLKIQNFLPKNSKDNFLKFLNAQNELKYLTIEYDCLPPAGLFDDLFLFIFGSPNLVTLRIYSYQQIGLLNYSIFGTINPNIETFYFSMINGTPDTPPGLLMELFSRVMPNLRKFDFYLLPLVVTKEDIVPLNQMKKLEDLSVNSCKKDVIKDLHLENLERLRFHFEDRLVANLISEDWTEFFKKHPKIRTLKLYDELNESILLEMTKSLQDLQHLEMEIFASQSAKIVVENCKKLRYVKFYIKENSTAKDDICRTFEIAGFFVEQDYDSVYCTRMICD